MTRSSPFLFLVAVSGLAHLAGAGGALVYLTGDAPATNEKASIRVALGSRGASAGQPVETETLEVPEAKPEPKPQPRPHPKPKPVSKPEPQPVADPAIEPEPVLAPDDVITDPEPEPAEAVSQAETAPGNTGVTGTSTESETDTDGDAADAGYQALVTSYDGMVLGHLATFKTFPVAARMRGEEGNVGVEFVIDRDGQLVECRMLDSSGSRRLDKAALRQLRSAVPYPEAPAEVDWVTRVYRTQMRYSLN